MDSSGVAQIVPFSAKLIAQNAEVVKISAGNLTKMESALKSAGFVDLIVSKKEAPAVVAGALPDVKNIVLVRKFTKDKGLENEQEVEESAAFFQKKETVP